MIFIGIDLAWTYKNETGICILSDQGEVLNLSSDHYSDDDLVDLIKTYANEDIAIGIDAPLVVNNEKGSRPAEGAFMRHKIHGHHLSVFAVSRSYLMRTYKVIRGEVLMKKIQEAIPKMSFDKEIKEGQSTFFETFPSGICAGMFPEIYPVKYKIKGKVPYETTYKEMLRMLDRFDGLEREDLISHIGLEEERANLRKKSHKHLEDMVDAFLCAYAGYGMYKGFAKTLTYGSLEEGMIMMPEVDLIDNELSKN
jgi:predicted RNase H-like nuclease